MKTFIENLKEAVDRDSDLSKLKKTIQSCKTEEQAKSAANMIKNYYEKYSKSMGAGQKVKFHHDVDKLRKELREFMKKRHNVNISRIDVGLI